MRLAFSIYGVSLQSRHKVSHRYYKLNLIHRNFFSIFNSAYAFSYRKRYSIRLFWFGMSYFIVFRAANRADNKCLQKAKKTNEGSEARTCY